MGFPREESWSVLPFPSPGDIPNSGIELVSPAVQAVCTTGGFFTDWDTREALNKLCCAVPSHFSHVQLFKPPQAVAHQAPPAIGFSRQEYWSGLPYPPPGDLPNPGSNLGLLHCRQVLYHWATREAHIYMPNLSLPCFPFHNHKFIISICVCVFFFTFFSLIGYYKILSKVACETVLLVICFI